jgi:putative hydrolase of the HAD superfamily
MDISQTPPAQAIFIDNTPIFVQIAERFGIRSILHIDYESTYAKLTSFGLQPDL